MRILLIGGNGFIGRPLTRELIDMGHEIAIFHRGDATADNRGEVVQIRGDRNRLSEYRPEIRRFAPEVIIDLILSSGIQAQHTMKVADGIARRVVVLSSMDVYRGWGVLLGSEPGGPEPLPITEDSPLRSNRQLYSPERISALQNSFSWVSEDYDKIAVEEAVRNQPIIEDTVVRLPMIYGPGDHLHRFFPLLKRVSDRRPCVILPDDFAAWRGPRAYVDNVAHAIALAATSSQASGHVYNLCEEPCYSELDWQKQIAQQLNWPGEFLVLPRERTPKHLLLPGNAAQHIVVSSVRIRKKLGYHDPIEIDEAIRRTIAWEQRNSPGAIDPQQFDYAAEDRALADAA